MRTTLLLLLLMGMSTVRAQDAMQQASIDSLKTVLSEAEEDTVVALTMYRIGKQYRRVNSDTAFYWLDKLIRFADEKDLPMYKAESFLIKANIYRFDNNFAGSIQSYRDAFNVFKSLKLYDRMAVAKGCIMKCFILLGEPRDSIQFYFDEVMALKDSVPPGTRAIADPYADYSQFLSEQGEVHSALSYLEEAIKIYEDNKDYRRIYYAKTVFAIQLKSQKNYRTAIATIEEILPGILELDSKTVYSSALPILAECYVAIHDYDNAEKAFRRGINFCEMYNIKQGVDEMYTGLAAIKLEQAQADSAIYFAEKAINWSGHDQGFGHSANLQLAGAYTLKGDYQRAEKYALGFLGKHREQEKEFMLSNVYMTLASLYEKWGKHDNACVYHRLYEGAQDSLFKLENAEKVADLEAWYWTTQKKNELALAKTNETLRAKEARQAILKSQLYSSQRNGLLVLIALIVLTGFMVYKLILERRRNRLKKRMADLELMAIRAQMDPHFMFNALSAIQLQINRNDIRRSNEALASFGKLMRRILENSGKQSISLQDEIHTLELYIQLEALRMPFEYEIRMDEDVDPEEVEIPPMMVQPFVENAIKHGIAGLESDRKVHIAFDLIGNNLHCTVKDNGIGRAVSAAQKSRHSQHNSMGIRLSTERLELLSQRMQGKASVNIKDLLNRDGTSAGTLVEIIFPLSVHHQSKEINELAIS